MEGEQYLYPGVHGAEYVLQGLHTGSLEEQVLIMAANLVFYLSFQTVQP